MAERPVVQINLPAMPNPKDFCISSNATTNAGLWQIALNAWREASTATAQAVAQSLAPDRDNGAVSIPVRVTGGGAPSGSRAEPFAKKDHDPTKN